jgi:hypothetical protein
MDVVSRYTYAEGDVLTLDSKVGPGTIKISVDHPPKEFDSIEIRVNVTEDGVITKDMIPPPPSRFKKLGVGP